MDVGRRTAERMRDAVWAAFPQMEAIEDPPTKRFRIPSGLDSLFQTPTADELAALRTAADGYAAGGAEGRAAALHALERKLMSALRGAARRKVAPDLEALIQAETIAVHPGPRPFEDQAVLAAIRTAVKGLQALSFRYEGGSAPGRTRKVTPLGILFGRANYLVAAEGRDPRPRTFRLDRMQAVTALDEPAPPPEDFSLQAFANESFGIYHGDIEDVALRIGSQPCRGRPALALPPQPGRGPGAGRLGAGHLPGQRHARAGLAPVHLERRGGDPLAAQPARDDGRRTQEGAEGARGARLGRFSVGLVDEATHHVGERLRPFQIDGNGRRRS